MQQVDDRTYLTISSTTSLLYLKILFDFWRTGWATLHNGGEDSALDSSPLLDLGIAIFPVLLNKIFSVPPWKTQSRLTQNPSLSHVIPSGNHSRLIHLVIQSQSSNTFTYFLSQIIIHWTPNIILFKSVLLSNSTNYTHNYTKLSTYISTEILELLSISHSG